MAETSLKIDAEELEQSITQLRSNIANIRRIYRNDEASGETPSVIEILDEESDRTLTPNGDNVPRWVTKRFVPLVAFDKDGAVSDDDYDDDEEPELDKTAAFVERSRMMCLRAKIIADQSQFLTDNYEQKRHDIDRKLMLLIHRMFHEVPPPHLRSEFANVVSYGITLAEMWGWITDVLTQEQKTGRSAFIPCIVMDMFDESCATLESCVRNSHIDLNEFSQLLVLRDEILLALQQHYRVVVPMNKGTNKDTDRCPPIRGGDVQYYPYDFEWLCGSVISGPYHLNAVKYMAITRMAQWDITNMRVDILAEHHEVSIDFIEGLRAPLPETVLNAKMLTNALHNREQRMQENYKKAFDVLADAIPSNRELRYTNNTVEFLMIRGEIRRKKRHAMDLMHRCEKSEVIAHLQFVAVMSALEAHLLVLLRCYAVYCDKKLGMYGKSLPRSVYRIMMRLLNETTIDICRPYPLNKGLSLLLDELRDEVHKYIREYYNVYEAKVDKKFRTPLDVASAVQKYRFTYPLTVNDFPPEEMHHSKTMIAYSHVEQIEMERLIELLCQVKRSKVIWPKNPEVPFVLNTCNDNLYSFRSNFADHMLPSEVAEVSENARILLSNSICTHTLGDDIVAIATALMHKAKVTPLIHDISMAFTVEFAKALGDRRVEDKSATDLSTQLVEIISGEIEMTNLRNVISQSGSSMQTAQLMAKLCVAKYMEHVNHHDEFVRQKRAIQSGELQGQILYRPVTGGGSGTVQGAQAIITDTIVEVVTGMQTSADGDDESDGRSDETLVDAARVAVMLSAMGLNPDPRDLFFEASASREDLSGTDEDEVPDFLIDAFLHNFEAINVTEWLDMDHAIFNYPVD